MKNKLQEIIDIVYSSERVMPAHFTSHNDRMQTFCVDFKELSADDEYAIANEAINSLGEYWPNKIESSNSNFYKVVKIGEDIMLGAFIAIKLDEKNLIDNIVDKILVDNFDILGDDKRLTKYFDHCKEFAIKIANL